MKKLILQKIKLHKLILSVLFLLIFTLASGNVFAAQKIKIGWVFAMANAPVVIAKEKGYFKELGLDVEILSFTSGPIVHQALAAGELDMAYIGAPPVYHWFSRGLDSRILAKVNYGQAAILVGKNSGIDSIEQLKGKKMAGVRKGSGMDVLLRGYVLSQAGKMQPDKDIQVIPMKPGNMGPSIESKVVDGAFTWEPFTSEYELRGSTKVIFDMNKAIPKYPWYIIMAMPEALKTKHDEIQKVLQAHKKAVEFLNSSPDAGNDIIAKTFRLKAIKDPESGKEIPATAIVAQARKRLGWEWNLNDKDVGFIQNLMDYSYNLGYIRKKLKAEEIIDSSFTQELAKAK